MEVLNKCRQNLSASVQRSRRFEIHTMGAQYTGHGELRQWIPRFGLSSQDFLQLLRFWLFLGYDLEDCYGSAITRGTSIAQILEVCDFDKPIDESAGGVWVVVRRPLRLGH